MSLKMNFWRQSAFCFGLGGVLSLARAELALPVRLPAMFRTQKSLKGPDMCQVLLHTVDGRYEEGQSLLDFIPGVGVGRVGVGIGAELRNRFSTLLAEADKIGRNQQEAVRDYLNAHGFLASSKLGALNAPPKASSPQEIRKIQQVMGSTPISEFIKARGKRATSNVASAIAEPEILASLDKIDKGNIVTAADILALKALRIRLDGLKTRAEKLQVQASESGQATLMMWEFLRDHDKALRKKINATSADQNVYLSYPVMSKSGELTISIKAFQNLEDYNTFYENYKRKGESALKYKKNLEEYTRDYMEYRYLANRFKNIEHDTVTFSSDGPKPEADAKEASDNEAAYKIYRAEIPKVMADLTSNIHPNPETAAWESRRIYWVSHPSTLVKTGYFSFATVALVPLFIRNVGGVASAVVQPLVTWFEVQHGDDAEYWINRCEAAEDRESLYECVKRFSVAAQRRTKQKIEAKKAIDPNYDGNLESLQAAQMSKKVLAKLYGGGVQSQIASAAQIDFDIQYLSEMAYGNIQLQLHELEEKQKQVVTPVVAPKEAPSPVVGGAGAQASVTPSGLNKANWNSQTLQSQVQEITKNFNRTTLDAKSMLPALAADSKKQTELVDYYSAHIQSLTEMGIRLQMLLELDPPDDVKVQMNALNSQIVENMKQSQTVLINFMAEAGARAAAASATIVPVAPLNPLVVPNVVVEEPLPVEPVAAPGNVTSDQKAPE